MDRYTYTSQDVAVILPCHSWPQYLPEALGSIQSQSVTPAATICILDGPPEPSRYEKILARYPDVVQVWCHTNQGPSVARNAGADLAQILCYKWLVFLDEDDLLHPKFLEKMLLSASLCPDRDIHYCDWVKFGKWDGYKRTPEYTYDRLLAGPFILSTSLIKTEVWRDVKRHNGHGFDPALHGWEDYLFALEAGALRHYGARVGLGLVRYRRHAASISSAAHARLPEIVAYIKKTMRKRYDIEVTYEVPK